MTENIMIDLDVQESNDFFRVSNVIESIESSKDKDIEKIKLLYKESKKLFHDLEIAPAKKIKGLKWNNQSYIHKEMDEKELLSEIEKCIEERYHPDQAQRNLIALSLYYKRRWSNSKHYTPFFNYTLKLIDRIISNPRISEIQDDIPKSKQLLNVVSKIEQENLLLKEELDNLQKKMEFIKVDIRDTFMSEEMFKVMGEIYRENIADPDLIRMILLVQIQKTVSIKKIFTELKIAPADIRKILNEYQDYFDVSSNNEVSINTEGLTKKASQNVETRMGEFLEIERGQTSVMNHMKKILSGFNKAKK